MLLDHGHQEYGASDSEESKGTHGLTCYLWTYKSAFLWLRIIQPGANILFH